MKSRRVRDVLLLVTAVVLSISMLYAMLRPPLALSLATMGFSTTATAAADTSWYPPRNWSVNSLSSAINDTGTYGFIFNSSSTPSSVPYPTYNWCNMPHVRRQEYVRAPEGYTLRYVELIQRHHKRTPYAANCFPVETTPWSCADAGLFYYGEPLDPQGNASAATYWTVFQGAQNPFNYVGGGCTGNCGFPQITRAGLDDAWEHGRDLYRVYHDELHLIPDAPQGQVPRGRLSAPIS